MRRFLSVAAVSLAVATFATAAEMMPPGPSPESGLAGVWRIIGAAPAPWVKAHRLTKAEAPLLEYAVEFKDQEVKGPKPLACPAAKYSSGVSYAREWFGGRLANDASGAMAGALHLSPQPTTFRVICSGAARDYYIDENADIVMAEGDVIYTLERPTGMDPEQYKAGYSGPSFDCTRAAATGERLICIDAALAKIDAKLGTAYAALQQQETPAGFANMQAGERAWVAYVMKSCGANAGMPDNTGDKNSIIECLSTAYGDRADLIAGLSVEKAGALVLEPRIRFRTRRAPDTEESDIYPFMSGGPQADTFNAALFKALKLDQWRMDDKALFRYGDDVNDMKLHAHRAYAAARFDARVVSLRIATSDFVGGRDEEYARSAFTWDVGRARPIALSDVFVPGAAWQKFALDFSMKALRKQMADDNMPADLDISDVRATIANGANWLWGPDKATVMFTVFMNSGMPAMPTDIDIPYAALKPYMKPDAAVLARAPA
jgi:uncharacterized protein YecT (DUF1311 family)